jgi:hypothetical protein
MTYSDKNLSQKLERAEAAASANFVETRAALSPASGAEWIDVDGAYAMYDGVGSPLTQTFGLGLFGEASDAGLGRLEAFFSERGAAVFHEVSPMADPSLLSLLSARGYRPVELTSVLFRELDDLGPVGADTGVSTRIIGPDEEELWARTSSGGWSSEAAELADFMYDFGLISAQAKGGCPFLAEIGGTPVGTGMLFINDGVAVLAGASTIPGFRSRGAQSALLGARLRHASESGCGLATMGALPGSQSQRHAEKNGFRIAYTRIKWQKAE